MSRTVAKIHSISSPKGNDENDENEHRLIFSSVLSRTPTTDDDDKDDDENNDDHSFRSLSSSFLPSPLLLNSCIFFLSVYVLRISFFSRVHTKEFFKKKLIKCQKTQVKNKKKFVKKIKRFSLTFHLLLYCF